MKILDNVEREVYFRPWIVPYPADKVIRLLNNWGLMSTGYIWPLLKHRNSFTFVLVFTAQELAGSQIPEREGVLPYISYVQVCTAPKGMVFLDILVWNGV